MAWSRSPRSGSPTVASWMPCLSPAKPRPGYVVEAVMANLRLIPPSAGLQDWRRLLLLFQGGWRFSNNIKLSLRGAALGPVASIALSPAKSPLIEGGSWMVQSNVINVQCHLRRKALTRPYLYIVLDGASPAQPAPCCCQRGRHLDLEEINAKERPGLCALLLPVGRTGLILWGDQVDLPPLSPVPL